MNDPKPNAPAPLSGQVRSTVTGLGTVIVGSIGAINPSASPGLAWTQPPAYTGFTLRGSVRAQSGQDEMADAALTAEVHKLGQRIEELGEKLAIQPSPPPKPALQTFSYWIPIVLGAVAVTVTLFGVERSFGELGKRVDDVSGQIQSLDHRLTPAIEKLTDRLGELHESVAVDRVARPAPAPSGK